MTATLLLTVDQLAVGLALGTTSLGLYSAAYLGYGFVLRIPTLIGTVIYPRLQRELGATSDAGQVFAMASRTTDVLVISVPVLVGVASVALPALVYLTLPQFREAVGPMRLLLIGVAGLAFAMPAGLFLLTVNRQRREVAISGSILAIMAVAYLVAGVTGTMSLEVAAAVDAAAYIGYGIVMQVAAHRVAGRPVRAAGGPNANVSTADNRADCRSGRSRRAGAVGGPDWRASQCGAPSCALRRDLGGPRSALCP